MSDTTHSPGTGDYAMVKAGLAYASGQRDPACERNLAVAVGVEVFGDGRLAGLHVCRLCGCIGDLGDDCGRSPAGHRLTAGGRL